MSAVIGSEHGGFQSENAMDARFTSEERHFERLENKLCRH
jgi:hypothetical protein